MSGYENLKAMIEELGNEAENFAPAEMVKEELQMVLEKAEAFDATKEVFKRQHGAMDASAMSNVYFSVRDEVRWAESGDSEC